MKISTEILKKVINIPENILELTNKHIIEIDGYEPLVDTTPLVVGHVLECIDHPDSDHLHVTKVDVGDDVLQIVCGAKNVAKGQYVVVAKVGTILPGNFQIKLSKIRGVESSGMICSLTELGIDQKDLEEKDLQGIHAFDTPQKVGSNALEALSLDGHIIELGLTPNRSDLLSVLGFAKDLSAVTKQKLIKQTIDIHEIDAKNPFKIQIESKKGYLYLSRTFENIKIASSPWWLKASLIASGITPINNVVDITNYILMLYGQPLHAFDQDKLDGKTIYVSESLGEEVVALDGKTYHLQKGDLTIRDAKKAVAIAGVMGLENSMIEATTTRVLLEAAIFEPQSVKETSERLNLRSDSSLRFERGIDHTRTLDALNHAAMLFEELAGAKTHLGVTDAKNHTFKTVKIHITTSDINEKLGLKLENEVIVDYLKRLGFKVKQTLDLLELNVPSYRFDIKIGADVVEEVGRLYGLDDISNQTLSHQSVGKLSSYQQKLRALRHFVANQGLNETINYSLVSDTFLNIFKTSHQPIALLKPLSVDRSVLRTDLAASLFSTAIYNQARQNKDLAIYEIGKVFEEQERLKLGILLSNKWQQHALSKQSLESSFFVIKGILENIFDFLGIQVSYEASNRDGFHPYVYAQIKYQNQIIGYVGQVHPKVTDAYDLDPTWIAQVDLDVILNFESNFTYVNVSKYPTITRDLALVLDQSIPASKVTELIAQTLKKVIVDLEIFDVYQGTHIKEGFKSVAVRLTLNDREKTLETKDIDALVGRVVKRLQFELKAEIRSA